MSAHDQLHSMDDVDSHAGEILDTQHGNRAGGVLHPNASQITAGFMSPADKIILDGISPGARSAITWHFGGSAGPGSGVNSGTPTIVRYSLYGGTGLWTPNIFAILAATSNAARPVSFDIYDVDNGNVIAVITGVTGTTPTKYQTTTITNLPAGLTTIAYRAYWTTQPATALSYVAYLAHI